MSKKSTESTVKPVRPLDPAWKVKFKSAKDQENGKKAVSPKPVKSKSTK